jgi:toxin CcdB
VAQFDVHRLGDGLVIDCQSDLLDRLESRFVVPLVPRMDAPQVAKRLNPVFAIAGSEYVMLTQAAAAVRRRELQPAVTSLADRSFEITGALDVLLTGI